MSDKSRDQLTRRNALKTLGVAGAGALAVPGTAAARSSGTRRRRRGDDNQYGTPEDPIVINAEGGSAGTLSAQGCREYFDKTVGIEGIDVGFRGYFGCCEAKLTVEILGQAKSTSLSDCSRVCRSWSYDVGMAMMDMDVCYDNNQKQITLDIEGKVWKVTGWAEFSAYIVIT